MKTPLLLFLKRLAVMCWIISVSVSHQHAIPQILDGSKSRLSNVQFRPFADRSFTIGDSEDEKDPCKVRLSSVASPSEGILVLGGSIRCPSLGSRSLILYSANEGRTWVETGKPIWGRNTDFLHFVSTTRGFGLSSHQEEGYGEETILTTYDGGKNWSSTRDLPKGENPHMSWVRNFKFEDSSRGTFSIQTDFDNVMLSFSTIDGGKTWEFLNTRNSTREGSTSSRATLVDRFSIEENKESNTWVVTSNANPDKPRVIAVLSSDVPPLEVAVKESSRAR